MARPVLDSLRVAQPLAGGDDVQVASAALLRPRLHAEPQQAAHVECNSLPEAHVKELNYRPAFSGRFGSMEAARMTLETLLDWDNNQHRHLSLG
jgi:hypothetical protein